MRRCVRSWKIGFLAVALASLSIPALCQSNALWSGSAQCTIVDQDQAYQRQEAQTWALTGAAPTQQGAMQIYPAIWTATGTGQLQRVQGPQTNNTAWQTNAQGAASIAFFVRASDGRLIITTRHARQTVYGGISAKRQITANGVPQSPTPLSQTVFEWMFPRIEADPSATVVDGSAQSPTEGLPADFAHRFGTPPPNAACQWHFWKDGVGSTNSNPAGTGGTQNSNQPTPPNGNSGNPSSQNCETPATVQQSFETMKAQLKAQYDQLIQGTTDPNEVAALTNQEQKMLASLSNQEQRDMTLAAQGCMPPSNTSTTSPPPPTGSQNPSNPGTGGQGNQNPPSSGTPTASVSLTTASSGNGNGVVAMTPTGSPCGANCAQYSPGTSVTVIAVPSNGSAFTSFSGGGCGSANPCSFAITTPTTLTAGFSLSGPPTAGSTTTGSNPPSGVGTTASTGVTSTAPVTPSSGGTKFTRPIVTGVPIKPTTGVVKTTTGTTSSSNGTSSPPAPTSATYRVIVDGLICVLPTTGGGDAVYPAAFIRQYDRRSGQVLMSTEAETWVYGNVNGMQDQRKQAGTMSSTGGIGVGNFIPTGFVPGIRNTLPEQQNLFPLTLFDGTLTDGVDALAISPSVWESYGDRSLLYTWVQNQTSFSNSLLLDPNVQSQISGQGLGVLFVGSSQNAPGSVNQAKAESTTSTAYDVATAFGGPSSLLGGLIITGIVNALQHPGMDRPLGLADANSSSIVLPNATVVLTREIVEKYMGSKNWMILAIDFKDTSRGISGGDHPGDYTMFVEIDRTAGSGNAAASPGQSTSPATSSTTTATASAPPNVTTTQAPSNVSAAAVPGPGSVTATTNGSL